MIDSSCCGSLYIKPITNDHFQKGKKMVFNTNYCLMQVKSIEECSTGSILQYIRPSLSYHFFIKIFVLSILSGCLRQVLLYKMNQHTSKAATSGGRSLVISLALASGFLAPPAWLPVELSLVT